VNRSDDSSQDHSSCEDAADRDGNEELQENLSAGDGDESKAEEQSIAAETTIYQTFAGDRDLVQSGQNMSTSWVEVYGSDDHGRQAQTDPEDGSDRYVNEGIHENPHTGDGDESAHEERNADAEEPIGETEPPNTSYRKTGGRGGQCESYHIR
jgi:hypothetical protein